MSKNKQRRFSYYDAGREHGKTLNAFFRVTNYKGRRWLNSGEYLRGLTDEIKAQLKCGDVYRISSILWYVSELPQPARGHVISKTGIKLDMFGYPIFERHGVTHDGCGRPVEYKPTLKERVIGFFGNLFR